MTYKTSIWKKLSCPYCSNRYEVLLQKDEFGTDGLHLCDGTGCNRYFAYFITRGYTKVAEINRTLSQAHRFRRDPAESPAANS